MKHVPIRYKNITSALNEINVYKEYNFWSKFSLNESSVSYNRNTIYVNFDA